MLLRLLLCLCLCLTAAVAAGAPTPLRLPDGEPLVSIYYFTHWWDPWKSDDGAILRDFHRLRDFGFNTLLLDQEWSQAIDGDWKWLDRDFRLAKEAGLKIVPWLSLKTWSDISPGDRAQRAKAWFGVNIRYGETQDGQPAAPLIYDESVISAGAKYATMYLDRYRDGPLLRLRWNGRERPVICLGVESAWDGSFDAETNRRFVRQMRARYQSITALNRAWGTAYAGFDAVDPRDKAVFDYAGHSEGRAAHPAAVEEHVAFRAGVIRDSLKRMAGRVRRKHPDALFLAEIPYQYESEHPHARSYRIQYGADPISCDYADIVLFRCTGPLSDGEAQALQAHQKRTGQRFILTYRTYSDWDVASDAPEFQRSVTTYAGQAADLASGFGFYSFNEMGDTHLAFSPAMSAAEQKGWTAERYERAFGLVSAMVKRYRELVGGKSAMLPCRLPDAPMQPDFSRLPRFYTSDPVYDAFLNDYFMRHLSVDSRGIYLGGGPILGATDHMWVLEWDAWMLPWMDRPAMGLARQGGDATDVIRTTLRTAAIDRYGYVYGARPEPEPKDSLGGYKPTFGWPWPKYNRNTTVTRPTGWEFNDLTDGARSEWTAQDIALELGYVDHSLVGRITGPRPEILSPAFDVDAFQVPIIELDITYRAPAGAGRLVDGLKVCWATDREPGFSESRCVTADFSALPPRANAADYAPWVSEQEARYALYFPMRLHPEWGKGGRRITRLKIVPAGSEATGATVALNYVRASYDVRMTTTNSTLINATHRFYMWSGDTAFLEVMLPRLRRAVMFQNEHLRGRKEGLLCTDWLAGHDGLGGDAPGHGQIGSYWDLLPSGRFDLESSAAYYAALNALAALEEAAARRGIRPPDVTVVGPDNRSVLRYRETPATLRAMARRVKVQIESRLWTAETGRFCRNLDSEGRQHDYGYVHFNVLALALGIGTPEQRDSILSWLDGRRMVEGDTSTGADIYRWRFAPRTSTRRNERYYFWPWNWEKARDPKNPLFAWGNQMQDGGAVPFTSFFELLARCRTGDPAQRDRAFARTREIQAWYADVKAAGGQGRDFYRTYYTGHPERGIQQSPTPGGLGLDREFLSDASLGTIFLPFAFLGLEAREEGVLDIAPAVPSALAKVGVENVFYRGNYLTVEAGPGYVSLAGSRIPNGEGLKARITLHDLPEGARLLVDGRSIHYRREPDGRAVVITALKPLRLEIH